MPKLDGDALLEEFRAEPASVIDRGQVYLRSLKPDHHAERSKTHRALSLAFRVTSRTEESAIHALHAVECAKASGDQDLFWLANLTLAGVRVTQGRLADARRILERGLAECSDELIVARLLFQRAFLHMTSGDMSEAMQDSLRALPIFENHGETSAVLVTLQNLGYIETRLGRVTDAERHLEQALEHAQRAGLTLSVEGIEHNLGVLASLVGDIPLALRRLTRSDELYMELTGDPAPQHVARAEVLLSVGLTREASQLVESIVAMTRERGDDEHLGNALEVLAEIMLLEGDREGALAAAIEAVETLSSSDRHVQANRAKLTALAARFEMGDDPEVLLTLAEEVRANLSEHGEEAGHDRCLLMMTKLLLALERHESAEALSEQLPTGRGPVERRISAWLGRALVARALGRNRAASRAALAGLEVLDRYHAVLGSTELRLSLERTGMELARLGVGLAVESADPRRIFRWFERSRARALRHPPVLPSSDPELRSAMAELRRVEADIKRADGPPGRTLVATRRSLQSRISQIARRTGTNGVIAEHLSPQVALEALGSAVLVELGLDGDTLLAVRMGDGRARRHRLGDSSSVFAELGQLRFSMRRAARLGRRIDHELLVSIDNALFGNIDLGDGEVIIVPPPELMALPWAALPSLRGRPLVVSPSAELWLRARRAPATQGPVAVAGGPDLELASDEVRRVASLYEDAIIREPGASVEDVKTAIDGASIAHVAAHASFEVQNPMFSSLRLGDGNLNVYDLQRLNRAPAIVVLSACDSGYTEARPGEELAGLTSALLSMGTKTIVASVGLVPDAEVTADLMVDFHEGIISGRSASESLANAQAKVSDDSIGLVSAASFICVGN